MSFIKKIFARVGIGNIEVDTEFYNTAFIPGEHVEGVVNIKGGTVEQKVDKLNIQLKTEYMKPVKRDTSGDGKSEVHYQKATAVVARYMLAENLVIAPGQQVQLPFNFRLPHEMPMSKGSLRTWIHTGLDIDNAADPTDLDYIQVSPHRYTTIFFHALEELGFKLRKIENLYYTQKRHSIPFIQEFEFVPTNQSPYKRSIDELEFVLYPSESGIYITMELDRKARGFSGFLVEMMDTDESIHRFSLSSQQLQQGSTFIANILQQIFSRQL